MSHPTQRRVIAQQWVSLDGFAAGPDGEAAIFESIDPAADERSQQHNETVIAGVDQVLLGRRTYEQFVQYWPTADEAVAPLVNRVRKVVASTTLTEAPWGDHAPAEVTDDAAGHCEAVRSGDVLVWGSLHLVQVLHEHGLLDELDLFVAPVVLGQGRPLLRSSSPVRLEHLGSEDWGAVTHARYRIGR